MESNFHNPQITRLGNRSVRTCLELAARTFGTNSPYFQAVHHFMEEKRAGYVVKIRNYVVGFIIYDNHEMDVTKILALAVRKQHWREGIGSQLLNRVVRLPRKEIITHVDEWFLETQLFLRSQGFRAVAIERGTPEYYVFKRSGMNVASSITEVKPFFQAAGVTS